MKTELKEKLGLTDSDFATHESDLYVVATAPVVAYLKKNYRYYCNVTKFRSSDGRTMLDIPFANEEFWDKRLSKETEEVEQDD